MTVHSRPPETRTCKMCYKPAWSARRRPVNGYSRPCRWCGTDVTTTTLSRASFAVCAQCSHGTCSQCGAPVTVVVNSWPPESRTCHACRKKTGSKRPLPAWYAQQAPPPSGTAAAVSALVNRGVVRAP